MNPILLPILVLAFAATLAYLYQHSSPRRKAARRQALRDLHHHQRIHKTFLKGRRSQGHRNPILRIVVPHKHSQRAA